MSFFITFQPWKILQQRYSIIDPYTRKTVFRQHSYISPWIPLVFNCRYKGSKRTTLFHFFHPSKWTFLRMSATKCIAYWYYGAMTHDATQDEFLNWCKFVASIACNNFSHIHSIYIGKNLFFPVRKSTEEFT